MVKYVLHGRMSKDHDWHFLGVYEEHQLKEKADHYFKTWRYLDWSQTR